MKKYFVSGLVFGMCWASTILLAAGGGVDLHGLIGTSFRGRFDDGEKWDLKTGFGGGGSLFFAITRNVKLDLGADFIWTEVEDWEDVSVYLVPISATLRLGVPLDSDRFFLYGGGGAGYSLNYINVPGSLPFLDINIKPCACYHLAGGAEFHPLEGLGFRAELRYLWIEPEYENKNVDMKWDWDLSHLQFRAGINLYF